MLPEVSDVDLGAGMLTVKTSKTGGNVEIPIFAPLQAVLTGLEKPGKGYMCTPKRRRC